MNAPARAIVLAALLAGSARAAEPLEVFEPFVGGQWISSLKQPNGRELRSRTVWTWGVKRKLVRLQQYVSGEKGEVQRYEAILFHDPAERRIVYRVFSAQGLLSRGVARSMKGGVVLDQSKQESFPAMRTEYVVESDDQSVSRVYLQGEAGWKLRVEARMRRVELGEYKRLELAPAKHPLLPMGALLDTWEFRPESEAPPRTWTGAWSLHDRLLRIGERVLQGADSVPNAETYVSFDSRNGVLLAFRIFADGGFREGTIVPVRRGKDLTLTWLFPGTAEVPALRIRDSVTPGERIERIVETKAEGVEAWKTEWKAVGHPR